jgi:hypothetical protein
VAIQRFSLIRSPMNNALGLLFCIAEPALEQPAAPITRLEARLRPGE